MFALIEKCGIEIIDALVIATDKGCDAEHSDKLGIHLDVRMVFAIQSLATRHRLEHLVKHAFGVLIDVLCKIIELMRILLNIKNFNE
mmetsp:Transcript_54929/g.85445  ORF Transcript_54929/g.85445 Transcript_54929/m.85445 type:complete len:87 (+) Transcript_54929:172-432(+)